MKDEDKKKKTVKRKGRSDTGKPLDQVDLAPKLETEAKGSSVVLTFGRMNPITIGHEHLVKRVLDVARKERADAKVFLSHSQDKKKNPLSYDQKIKYAKRAFGSVVQRSRSRNIIEVLKELQDKYDSVVLVVGSDRIVEFKKLLNNYNGKEFNFTNISVVSAGNRDPDSEGVSGMSASKMRDLAAADKYDEFKKGTPEKMSEKDKRAMFDDVRSALGINEEVLDEKVLTIQQRMKRKQLIRRLKSRIMRGRRIAKKRLASNEKLQKRASRKARQLLRKRLAGKQGEKYNTLSPGAKIAIDKRLEGKQALIKKLAKRLLPRVRKAEFARRAAALKGPVKEAFLTPQQKERLKQKFKREKEALKKRQEREKDAAMIRSIRQEDRDLMMVIDKFLDNINSMELNVSVMNSLTKKSMKTGIHIDTLKEVYLRGIENATVDSKLTVEQQAFNRVNSFINGGKAAKEDNDLRNT